MLVASLRPFLIPMKIPRSPYLSLGGVAVALIYVGTGKVFSLSDRNLLHQVIPILFLALQHFSYGYFTLSRPEPLRRLRHAILKVISSFLFAPPRRSPDPGRRPALTRRFPSPHGARAFCSPFFCSWGDHRVSRSPPAGVTLSSFRLCLLRPPAHIKPCWRPTQSPVKFSVTRYKELKTQT